MKTVLLITYTTSPYKGSEASVSWNYITQMSASHRLVVVYAMGRNDVERWVMENGSPNGNVIFHNVPIAQETFNCFWDDVKYQWMQFRWHYRIRSHVRELCRQYDADIIHYLNPIGFRAAGHCWHIDLPYVWGPISGVHTRPLSLWRAQSAYGIASTLFRLVAHNAALYFSPSVHRAIKHTDVLLTATRTSQRQFERIYGKKSVYLPENGIIEMNTDRPVKVADGEKIRMIWVGAIIDRKALILPLKGLAKLSEAERRNIELHIVGDGYLRQKMERFCREHGLQECVIFHGKVERSEVLKLFTQAHIHIISSLCEATTTVLLEAMSNAVPTMTLDHCGMAGVVCEKCGIKIAIGSQRKVTDEFARQFKRIIDNPDIIESLSAGVLDCAKKYMWQTRIAVFDKAFEDAGKIHAARHRNKRVMKDESPADK